MATNLITGGMGFVGAYLARELLAEGEEVVLFQRRSKLPSSLADLEGKVKIISGDISNWVLPSTLTSFGISNASTS